MAKRVSNNRSRLRRMASNTGRGSVDEPLMEASISAVADCRSSASFSSSLSRSTLVFWPAAEGLRRRRSRRISAFFGDFLAASHFSWFAACSRSRSDCLPQAPTWHRTGSDRCCGRGPDGFVQPLSKAGPMSHQGSKGDRFEMVARLPLYPRFATVSLHRIK